MKGTNRARGLLMRERFRDILRQVAPRNADSPDAPAAVEDHFQGHLDTTSDEQSVKFHVRIGHNRECQSMALAKLARFSE